MESHGAASFTSGVDLTLNKVYYLVRIRTRKNRINFRIKRVFALA